jgi:hypothetical protein
MKKRIGFAGLILLIFSEIVGIALALHRRSPISILPQPDQSTALGTPIPSTVRRGDFSKPLLASELCPSIQQGLTFLAARYNPILGLLNESPRVAPEKYWLTNDNALAAFTFSQLGQPDMKATLQSSLRRDRFDSNGLIEVLWGLPVSFPPHVARPVLLSKVGSDEIWQEFHDDGPLLEDWAEYANLGFLGALNEHQQGHPGDSLSIFSNTLNQFDGVGFHDKAFNGLYETYKVALALYVGITIDAPIPDRDTYLRTLQAMQTMEGGFRTHYRNLDQPEGDQNTETTSIALLAASVYGCAPR